MNVRSTQEMWRVAGGGHPNRTKMLYYYTKYSCRRETNDHARDNPWQLSVQAHADEKLRAPKPFCTVEAQVQR